MVATAIGTYATATALKTLAGITDSADDALIGSICDRVNQAIEDITGRPIAPITSTTYLYDGDGSRMLHLPLPVDNAPIGGIRALTLVETMDYTGGTFTTVTSTDYFLRNKVGMTGPYEWLMMSDRTGLVWPAGYATVRLTGTAGWTAIPDKITEIALSIAQRTWNARQTGQQDVSGTDEMGRPIVNRYMSLDDKIALRKYSLDMVIQ